MEEWLEAVETLGGADRMHRDDITAAAALRDWMMPDDGLAG